MAAPEVKTCSLGLIFSFPGQPGNYGHLPSGLYDLNLFFVFFVWLLMMLNM